MRTTLDIDEDVLQAARDLAAARKETLGKVVSELARAGLRPSTGKVHVRNGVPLLEPRPGARTVSSEDVRRLLEDDLPDVGG